MRTEQTRWTAAEAGEICVRRNLDEGACQEGLVAGPGLYGSHLSIGAGPEASRDPFGSDRLKTTRQW